MPLFPPWVHTGLERVRVAAGDLTLEWALVAVLSLLAALLAAQLWWTAGRGRRVSRARMRRAIAGERHAATLLADAGYHIEARQERAVWWIEVDGVEVEVEVRADFIVTRHGHRLVAEVKTGERVVEPTHPQTRRQLLEYKFAFGIDELLLVDPEADAIHHLRFMTDADESRYSHFDR